MDRPWQLDGILRALWNAQQIAQQEATASTHAGMDTAALRWLGVAYSLRAASKLVTEAQIDGQHES